MAKEKKQEKMKNLNKTEIIAVPRGAVFKGKVIRKFPKRVTIEFERTVYIKKYQRFYRKRTKLHAMLPESMYSEINLGDDIKVRECRPISKIVNFVVIGKINSAIKEIKK